MGGVVQVDDIHVFVLKMNLKKKHFCGVAAIDIFLSIFFLLICVIIADCQAKHTFCMY